MRSLAKIHIEIELFMLTIDEKEGWPKGMRRRGGKKKWKKGWKNEIKQGRKGSSKGLKK